MYSLYESRYVSRHQRSSAMATERTEIISTIESKMKSHEAEAIPTPKNRRNKLRNNGCLEYRYIPLVNGSSGGVMNQGI